jgi:hypothetical protein
VPHHQRTSSLTSREADFDFQVLAHRLVCSWHMAAGQLAVFQGASEAPLSES